MGLQKKQESLKTAPNKLEELNVEFYKLLKKISTITDDNVLREIYNSFITKEVGQENITPAFLNKCTELGCFNKETSSRIYHIFTNTSDNDIYLTMLTDLYDKVGLTKEKYEFFEQLDKTYDEMIADTDKLSHNQCVIMLKELNNMLDSKCVNAEEYSHAINSAILYIEECVSYNNIGTVQGYIDAIQSYTDTYVLMKEYKSKLQAFEKIGTAEEFDMLKERNREQQTEIIGDGYSDGHLVYDTYICPNCGKQYELEYEEYNYCPECGQHMKIPKT